MSGGCDSQVTPGFRSPPLLPGIGGLDLSGRTVLVTHEEGFGDTL